MDVDGTKQMRILNLLTTFALPIITLLVLGWLLVLPTTAISNTHHIAPGGDCNGASPCYATFQAAIECRLSADAVQPDNEMHVAQGTYTAVTVFEHELAGTW